MKLFSVIKEHMLGKIGKSYKYIIDVIAYIEDDEDKPFGEVPIREIFKYKKISDTDPRPLDKYEAAVGQNGLDIKYKEDLRRYNKRKEVFEQNLYKAYEEILGYCNKSMKARILEQGDYDSRIDGNIWELFKEISSKMYGPD